MVNGKNKGSLWENTLLKQVKEIDPMAHKTLGSGNSADDKGDIAFLHFLIEAKHHKSLTKKQIDDFWKKICKEADNHKGYKEPLLVYKENRKAPMVMFRMGKPKYGVRHLMFWEEFYAQLEEAHC